MLIRKEIYGNCTILMADIPNSNHFKYRISHSLGSVEEDALSSKLNKDIYGIMHLNEHLSFKSSEKFTTPEINDIFKNKGRGNAATGFNGVQYFLSSTHINLDLVIDFVSSVANNDLSRVGDDEFLSERDVVFNEAKRYYDDPEASFSLAFSRLTSANDNSNVLGSLDNISKMSLSDCQFVKSWVLDNCHQYHFVTYDSSLISEDIVLDKIMASIKKGSGSKLSSDTLIEFKNLPMVVDTVGEQRRIIRSFEYSEKVGVIENISLLYLVKKASTSINEVIREKHGLTYGVSGGINSIGSMSAATFGFDFSKGNEGLALRLIDESIQETISELNEEKFNVFKDGWLIDLVHNDMNKSLFVDTVFDKYINNLEDIRYTDGYIDTNKTRDNLILNEVTIGNMELALKECQAYLVEGRFGQLKSF